MNIIGSAIDNARKPGRPSKSEARVLDERILDVAFELLLVHGFDQTTIEGIAESCGTTRPSIMRRYDSKSALFLAAVERYRKRAQRRIWGEASSEEPLEELRDSCRKVLAHALSDDSIAFFRVSAASVARVPGLSDLILKWDQDIRIHIERVVLRAQSAGLFQRHSAAALSTMAMALMVSNPINRAMLGDSALLDDHGGELYFSSMWALFLAMA